jgi:hypothetical protein
VVSAIKVTVKVNTVVAVGCPTAGSETIQVRFWLQGYFFSYPFVLLTHGVAVLHAVRWSETGNLTARFP